MKSNSYAIRSLSGDFFGLMGELEIGLHTPTYTYGKARNRLWLQGVDALGGLGMTFSRMGQPKEAIRALERYLTLAPTAGDAASIRKKLAQRQ